jgi:mycofactocin precursor
VKEREEREPESENTKEVDGQAPDILEEIEIEEFAVDGICGVY